MSKFMRSLVVAVVLVLGPAVSAHALTLTTPLLNVGASALRTDCWVVNATSNNILQVTIQAFNQAGVPVTPPMIRTVDPGEAGVLSIPVGVAPRLYCRFSGNFTDAHVRAAIVIIDPFLTTLAAAPAY